jgi:crotonobetainyl-CoA:carnitine CoA-transferase CaiB-like acyl-CoA transferase
VGEGAAAVPSVRNPITFSDTPADYRLPPPALDEHGAEIRRWLSAPAAGPGEAHGGGTGEESA